MGPLIPDDVVGITQNVMEREGMKIDLVYGKIQTTVIYRNYHSFNGTDIRIEMARKAILNYCRRMEVTLPRSTAILM